MDALDWKYVWNVRQSHEDVVFISKDRMFRTVSFYGKTVAHMACKTLVTSIK
jgi:hypothetical protein